ncbi:hypothetical protein MAR_006163 [Mya arenaria]|uniref:Cyclic nucleotide-binding domain-containing protein n=1 Tax=Mya arenaria TaxID=6604 RepID=A0ABY7DA74_MYAAR|nr:uncharacterized protein LOC128238390 [Mya arenaria]WAQ93692.1 hypothetical protein MAR_006163 [Mya arenaria]
MRLKKLSDYLARLFDSPPGERSKRDIQAVLPVLTMKTQCLRDLDKGSVVELLQSARLERRQPDECVIRQGDVGDTFYIILNGNVSIYVDLKKDEKALKSLSDDNPQFPLPPPGRRFSMSTVISEHEGGEDLITDRQEVPRGPRSTSSRRSRKGSVHFTPKSSEGRRHGSHGRERRGGGDTDRKDERRGRRKYGMPVNTLGRYQNFGELALLYPNRQRNASVIVEEPTELLVITYDIFQRTLQTNLERDLDEKRLFIQTHPFFSRWTFHLQRQLQWSLVRSTHSIGDIVIRQGDPVSGLTFLVSGRARLAAEPMKHRLQFPELFEERRKSPFEPAEAPSPLFREDSTLLERADNMRYSKGRLHMLAGMEPLTYIRRTDGYAAAEKVVHDKLIDLCIIEEGEVLSDCELLLGMKKNMFSVICTSACTLFHLELKIFDRLIYKKSPHTLTMIKFLAERKLTRRLRSKQGQRLPILSPLLLRILDIRVVDPNEEKSDEHKLAFTPSKTVMLPRTPLAPKRPERSKTVLIEWFVKGKTPLLQPINSDAIYYREMIQKRARFRDSERKRGPPDQREAKSLGRRIKDSYWFNLREKRKAVNTMKRLKLEHSEVTQASRWK